MVVAAAGYWFYLRSKQIQAGNAEKALMQAKQSMTAGNMALAQSDLQKVYARYESTAAGVEAAMLLAQIDFDSGKFQDGISRLEKVGGSSAASDNESTIKSLEGDGYAQMGKMAEAAKAYRERGRRERASRTRRRSTRRRRRGRTRRLVTRRRRVRSGPHC